MNLYSIFFERRASEKAVSKNTDLSKHINLSHDILSGSVQKLIPVSNRRNSICHLLGEDFDGYKVLIVAPESSALRDHDFWLQQCTKRLEIVSSFELVQTRAVQGGSEWIWVLDAAVFTDMEEAVDALLEIRTRFPKPTIVLCSTEFGVHDLTCARARVVDASIRLPVSRPELALALSASVSNHEYIVNRRLI
ncbi:hypothetical protein M3N55_15120 [Roseibaca sp. V10]|uniref:Response regulatory domain-containing protein n=1 Tax=Roseinatronobacter domitianus TaxID=2940293 RepID=A0ABT0M5E1_9RHOB|nr:hypothetical protein [Roseibaca domitiana]MCL1630065.1 hypothetical protein [Roseibaca domitiana]